MSKQVDFTKIIENKEMLAVVLPTEADAIIELISSVCTWRKHFNKITFYLDEFSYSFFNCTVKEENISFEDLGKTVTFPEKSVVIDLRNSAKVKSIFQKSKNCIIAGNADWSNFRLLPVELSPIKKLTQISSFLGIPLNTKLLIPDTNLLIAKELDRTISELTSPVFSFYLVSFYNRFMMNVNILKYITGTIKGSAITAGGVFLFNEKSSQTKVCAADLYNLTFLAKKSDYFLTDNPRLYNFLAQLNIRQIFIGSGRSIKGDGVKLKPGNFPEFKRIVTQ